MADRPRDISMFVAAYEERSFTAAAARERATQSGVSQHIRKLEDRFGARLFSRSGGHVVPTPAGDAYYRSCIEVLRAHASAAQALRGFSKGLEGEVVVGLMPTMTRCALAPALARFLDAHPNVTVRVVEAYSATLTRQVRAGALAFAVVPAFAGAPGLHTRHFVTTPEVLVSARDATRPHLAPVRPEEIGTLHLIVPGRDNTRRQTVETYLASNGVPVAKLLELDAMLGTLDLVATTAWRTVLPGLMMARDIAPERFTINPLTGPSLSLDLVLIEALRRPLTPAEDAFLEVLREETDRVNAVWGAPKERPGAPPLDPAGAGGPEPR